MRSKVIKLLTVKSITTLMMMAVFCYLSITQAVNTQQFLTVFTMVISFYFGTQANKTDGKIVREDE